LINTIGDVVIMMLLVYVKLSLR